MDVGEIIGLLVALIFIVGKFVGKSLKSAGRLDRQEESHDADEPSDTGVTADAVSPEEVLADTGTVVPASIENLPAELLEGGYKSINSIVKERKEASGKKDDNDVAGKSYIDPKKLVIYSEIMNTKF